MMVEELFIERVRQVNDFEKRLDKEIDERGTQFLKYKDSLDKEFELLSKKLDAHF